MRSATKFRSSEQPEVAGQTTPASGLMMTMNFELLESLAGERFGEFDAACPVCGPDRSTPAKRKEKKLRIWRKEDGFLTYKCARCDAHGYAHRGGAERSPRRSLRHVQIDVEHERRQRSRYSMAMELWTKAKPLTGTLGERYFTETRGHDIAQLGDLSHVLRWHQMHGAVVALMTDAVTGKPVGVHRTFIEADATKRERKMLGQQGVIRLSPDEDVMVGRWLPIMHSVNCGAYSKKSCRMKRAAMGSPPVSCLSLASLHFLPFSVSVAVTRRAPRSIANSVGCRSPYASVNVSMGAVR